MNTGFSKSTGKNSAPSAIPTSLKQTKLTSFFTTIPKQVSPLFLQHGSSQTPPVMRCKTWTRKRNILLSCNKSHTTSPSVMPFLSLSLSLSPPINKWEHSLQSIDTSMTFHLFLQNPNGLKLHQGFHATLQDFQTCLQYGAAVLSLPEANTNWSLFH